MARHAVQTCAQCAAIFDGSLVGLGDQVFCCLGCMGAGACICDRPQNYAMQLRIGPFATQAELLRFASGLESAPGLERVEMTITDLREAHFAVVGPSTGILEQIVETDPNHTIGVEIDGMTLYARIAPPRRPRATPPPTDTMLPTRTRFRVFRSAPDAPTDGSGTPPATEEEIAAMLVEARKARRPAPKRPPPPPLTSTPLNEAVAEVRASRAARSMPPPPAARPTAAPVPPASAPLASARRAAAPPFASPPAPAAVDAAIAGQMVIVAAPFKSFAALNTFQDAIRAVRGVQSTHVRRFYRGTLTLVVEYEGTGVPFTDRVQHASNGTWSIVATEPNRFEVAIETRTAARTPGR